MWTLDSFLISGKLPEIEKSEEGIDELSLLSHGARMPE